MKKIIKKTTPCFSSLLLTSTLLFSNITFANTAEEWKFVLTPVLWNASVDATLSNGDSGGDLPIDPDYRFFTLENLDDYMSLKFEANHRRYGFLFDSLRARYQDDTSNTIASFTIGSELGFIIAAARYQLFDEHKLDLIAGVQKSFLDIDQTLTIGSMPGSTTKNSYDWTDPLIGLRYQYSISHNWLIWLRGNMGGFNASTQRIIDISTDIQYLINSTISLTMGYRYLKIDFKEDDVLYNVTLDGVYMGLGIHF
ncbi:MAG: hypothetical protein GQ572_07865 [Gammaproteobacteria bacterium]|nr:hypothetical protein [Gammaproteobacteria bacterium]